MHHKWNYFRHLISFTMCLLGVLWHVLTYLCLHNCLPPSTHFALDLAACSHSSHKKPLPKQPPMEAVAPQVLGGLSLTHSLSHGNYTKALATLPGTISWKPPLNRHFCNLKNCWGIFSLLFFRYTNPYLQPLVILEAWAGWFGGGGGQSVVPDL